MCGSAAKATAEDRVPRVDGCPDCGNDEMDRLAWRDDDLVECGDCGRVYEPMFGHVKIVPGAVMHGPTSVHS